MAIDRVGYHYETTRYGFKWGPFELRRAISDPKYGIVLTIKTKYKEVDIRITPNGRDIEMIEKEVAKR